MSSRRRPPGLALLGCLLLVLAPGCNGAEPRAEQGPPDGATGYDATTVSDATTESDATTVSDATSGSDATTVSDATTESDTSTESDATTVFDAIAVSDATADSGRPPGQIVVVTFNTGTSESMGHDRPPDDGYTSAHAELSDQWYGDGLAWLPAVQGARDFLEQVRPDLVAFQEVFWSGECPAIPEAAWQDFVCESWAAGQPTVAQVVLGAGWQVACHLGKNDKCLGVRRTLGTLRGCDADLCLDGLAGQRVQGCGGGSRVGRGVVELTAGGTLTVVSVHGSSGISADDQACRVRQFEQVFVDLGDGSGEPAANGERNLVLGDLNTDPVRMAAFDLSAVRFADFVGPEQPFGFLSDVAADAPASYMNAVNIDHVVSDAAKGSCWVAGLTEGHPAVVEAVYFDHKPVVCAATLR